VGDWRRVIQRRAGFSIKALLEKMSLMARRVVSNMAKLADAQLSIESRCLETEGVQFQLHLTLPGLSPWPCSDTAAKNPVMDLYSLKRSHLLCIAHGSITYQEDSHHVCRTNGHGDNEWRDPVPDGCSNHLPAIGGYAFLLTRLIRNAWYWLFAPRMTLAQIPANKKRPTFR
jgi:hypothetical protein